VAVVAGGVGGFINASDYETHEAWVRARFKFCGRCGCALREVTEQDGYDRSTGEPVVNRRLRCPLFLPELAGHHDDE
jgi:hypothetical protein